MSAKSLLFVPLLLAFLGAVFAYRRGTLALYISTFVLFRFHLGATAFILIFPSFAAQSPLLRGIMVIDSSRAIALVTALAFVAAWAVLVAVVITFVYGPRQFGTELLQPPSFVWTWRMPLASLLALPILYSVLGQSGAALWVKIFSAILGFGIAAVVLYIGQRIFQRLVPAHLQGFDLFFGTQGWTVLPEANPRNPERAVTRLLGTGVANSWGQIHPGHLAVLSFLAVVGVFYWAGYWLLAPSGRFFDIVPALAFVEFLLIVATLGLAGAAFILDRARLPVGLAIIGFSVLVYAFSDTDHHFLISPEKVTAAARDLQQSDLEPAMPGGDVVVVSAAGGGIQAAAWTARVLAGLQEDLGPEFARQVRFISAVSGGAVGAMYFVDAYTRAGPPSAGDLDAAVYAACSSSLSAVAWGLAYPDLLRVLWPLPIAPQVDRGWALEQSWGRYLSNPKATLQEWREDVAEGWRPATAFNATIAETGQRLVLTTAAFPTTGAISFADRYKAADVPVLRAARLAATFPYVSPMARALWSEVIAGSSEPPGDHLGDGGYYDSLGVVTLVDWLLQLKDLSKKNPRVLVIRIEPFPADELTKAVRGSAASARTRRGQSTVGWVYEALGPVLTMMNVRSSSQVARGDMELRLIREVIGRRGLAVQEAVFVPDHAGPLSWHLTREERRHIDEDWETARGTSAMRTVLDWMGRPLPVNRAVPHCSRR